jgi:hypothetical protein
LLQQAAAKLGDPLSASTISSHAVSTAQISTGKKRKARDEAQTV